MGKRITLIQGHPDLRKTHFGHALEEAYQKGALSAGHQVRRIDVAEIEFPVLRTKEDWDEGDPPDSIREAQEAIAWAEHLVIFYPLWLGTMPAFFNAFLEQVFRPGFAIGKEGTRWEKLLKGRSARIVVTMGMPASVYRWYFGAHSLKSLERNVLGFCGISPIKTSLIGQVGNEVDSKRREWLDRMGEFGAEGV